jgi:hypothetical protein
VRVFSCDSKKGLQPSAAKVDIRADFTIGPDSLPVAVGVFIRPT